MKIIDASALLAVLLDEAERPAIEALLANEELIAPTLLPYEIANSCTTNARRFPALEAKYADALIKFLDMTIALHEIDPIGAFVVARRYNLTAYDASYLWLSHEMGLELVTLDADLLAAAQSP